MQHRLAAAEGDDRRAKVRELVDARQHLVERHRLGDLVVLVAVAAVDVAAADRHEVDEQRMIGMRQAARELPHRPHRPAGPPIDVHRI